MSNCACCCISVDAPLLGKSGMQKRRPDPCLPVSTKQQLKQSPGGIAWKEMRRERIAIRRFVQIDSF